jgi:uncharacterized LabA/DUF88 family protein
MIKMTNQRLAAIMIDFDNIYASLTNQYGYNSTDAKEKTIKVIGNTLDHLNNSLHFTPIIRQAIADWSMYSEIPNELYTMGVKVSHVKAMYGKNSADIELSLNLLEVMLTRPEIDVLVIFAGDRDYLPVAQRVQERAKQIIFYSYEKCLSGDIKKLVGEDNYWYLDPNSDDIITDEKVEIDEVIEKDTTEAQEDVEAQTELNQDQIKALHAAIEADNEYGPIYGSVRLSGFLVDKLASALPEISHLNRKEIFETLVDKGLIETEISESPFESGFTVFKIKKDHALVKKEMEKINSINDE